MDKKVWIRIKGDAMRIVLKGIQQDGIPVIVVRPSAEMPAVGSVKR